SFFAKNSASLFSNPSPASYEKGRFLGSAQTRKTCGSTSSSDEDGSSPSSEYATLQLAAARPTISNEAAAILLDTDVMLMLTLSGLSHTLGLGLLGRVRLIFVLRRPSPWYRLIRSCA